MLFSAVIPVYNVAPYLRECLDSLVAQTCGDWEAVCVDDGSTDGSGAILDEYAARDSRFKVVHRENQGVSAARNAGLELVSGKWLLFVDADDVLYRHALAVVLNVADALLEAQAVGFRLVKFSGAATPEWTVGERPRMLNVAHEIPSCLYDISIPTIALRRDLFGDIRFKDFVLGEDFVYLSQCYVRMKMIAVVSDMLYGYRQREGSAVHEELTAERIGHVISYLEEMYRVLDASGKKLGSMFSRSQANGWFELCPREICRLNRRDRPAAWRRWFESMEKAKNMKCFSPWQRFVASMTSSLRSTLAARVLCVTPYLLKRAGFHR